MEVLTQKQRDDDAAACKKSPPKCIGCDRPAIGSWGLCIGRYSPFHYTPKMSYCREHLGDMIDGLALVVRDLKKELEKIRANEKRNAAPTR